MSQLGQKRRFVRVPITSGVHPTPDISLHRMNWRFVPKADMRYDARTFPFCTWQLGVFAVTDLTSIYF